MFKILLKKEILSHILTLRFAVAFGLIFLFVFSGFYVSVSEYKQNIDDFHLMERQAKNGLEQLFKEENPEKRLNRLFWSEGITVVVPVPPLSFIAQGLSASWPTGFNIIGRSGAHNIGRSVLHNPLSKAFTVPDFVYIVNILLSLLAILFIFDGVCGEKESGTLRLMLSFSVPRHLILLGKWLGGFLVLIIPFLLASLAGLGYAWFQGALVVEGGNLMLLALLIVLSLLYVSVFFTLGLFVSAMTKKPFTSLFVSLFIWVVLVLLIPNLAPVMSRIVSPIPASRKIEAEKAAVDLEITLKMMALRNTAESFNGSGEDPRLKPLREEGAYRKSRWDRFLERARERQAQISEVVGRLSPSSAWIYSAHALLKTGPDAYRAVLDGRGRLRKDMNVIAESMEKSWYVGITPDIKIQDIPGLHIQYYDTRHAIAYALNDILLIFVFNVLFFMGAFIKFIKYDVR